MNEPGADDDGDAVVFGEPIRRGPRLRGVDPEQVMAAFADCTEKRRLMDVACAREDWQAYRIHSEAFEQGRDHIRALLGLEPES